MDKPNDDDARREQEVDLYLAIERIAPAPPEIWSPELTLAKAALSPAAKARLSRMSLKAALVTRDRGLTKEQGMAELWGMISADPELLGWYERQTRAKNN